MRVLHFFKTYWPDSFGGVERVIHALAKGGVAHNIESDVLALSPAPSEMSLDFDYHRVFQVKCDLDIASTGFSRAAFKQFRQLSRSADVIHYHFPWPFMDIVDLVTSHGKPSVVTYHSDIVKQKMLLKLYTPLMHHFLGSASRIVATSPNYLASSATLQRYQQKTDIIPLGLDERDYPQAKKSRLDYWRQLFPGGFFLFVGVLRYYKGVYILLEAAQRSGIPVVIVGGGPHESELRKSIDQGGISNVHLVGALPDEDKIALLALCRALVFPSHLRSEAFGLSLVEAAMHGKPMISCEIGTGTSFVNLDQETGLVIAPDNVEALVSAMRKLWQNDALCEKFGTAARKRYVDYFTAQKMVESYALLYQSLIHT